MILQPARVAVPPMANEVFARYEAADALPGRLASPRIGRAPVDDEACAAERRAFGVRRAAVPFDDPLDDREPEAEAGLLAGWPSELDERSEHALAIRFGDARTIVLDAQAIA